MDRQTVTKPTARDVRQAAIDAIADLRARLDREDDERKASGAKVLARFEKARAEFTSAEQDLRRQRAGGQGLRHETLSLIGEQERILRTGADPRLATAIDLIDRAEQRLRQKNLTYEYYPARLAVLEGLRAARVSLDALALEVEADQGAAVARLLGPILTLSEGADVGLTLDDLTRFAADLGPVLSPSSHRSGTRPASAA